MSRADIDERERVLFDEEGKKIGMRILSYFDLLGTVLASQNVPAEVLVANLRRLNPELLDFDRKWLALWMFDRFEEEIGKIRTRRTNSDSASGERKGGTLPTGSKLLSRYRELIETKGNEKDARSALYAQYDDRVSDTSAIRKKLDRAIERDKKNRT